MHSVDISYYNRNVNNVEQGEIMDKYIYKGLEIIGNYLERLSTWSLLNRSEIVWFSLGVISILILQLIF